MDRSKSSLTNEKISRKFGNQFDLVNYAIKLAENMIKTGRDARVRTDSQNRALQVLAEISEDKDRFDEIITHVDTTNQPQAHSKPESSKRPPRKNI
ncbi:MULTISPECIES: hypothetical protein [Parachlamydia]|jgi:DNA-directed RNA polymerase subunit omega|uniref:Uncharacterized protein n=2 Tax=Parachlamydia acanthamoebae TaxID=83552 RepID=F8L0R5_PARAV|nr:hypothetical protein [Parachlamydia acanthamoebae]EFB42709.1 hypothetical protein pah_c004o270 [Parachlamydia acanthamoebae str. Hall's coccus]KIA77501.1 hypothetical protein DB43_GF00430 [Parachlamydia acanthamoebae]CCB86815.1 putative uncharacterized protein [Parachlamydia acanthamoebae UV-7]